MREPAMIIRAAGSPIETKELLKARRYSWNAEGRVWQRMLPKRDLEAEHAWLAEHVYRGPSRAQTADIPLHARFRRLEHEGG